MKLEKAFGEELRKVRERKGLSQEELGFQGGSGILPLAVLQLPDASDSSQEGGTAIESKRTFRSHGRKRSRSCASPSPKRIQGGVFGVLAKFSLRDQSAPESLL
jgi:hypothetical protein